MRLSKPIVPAFFAVWMSGSSMAATVWVPTDGDVNTFDFSMGALESSFGIFDDDNAALNPALGYLPLQSFDRVRFQEVGGEWRIENLAGDILALTGSERFLVAADNGSGWETDTGFSALGGGGGYLVEFSGDRPLLVVDASPVPLPGALGLMATGLMAVAGAGGRRRLGKRARRNGSPDGTTASGEAKC